MSNQKVTLDEMIKNANLATGLDLDITVEQFQEVEIEIKEAPEKDEEKIGHWCPPPCPPPKKIKLNCDLSVTVGSKNKVIYVCPGKLQYFTADVLSCSGDESIKLEFIGNQEIKCINGETFIRGRLGFYKIVTSGIIFIPKNYLSEFPDHCYPVDILPFLVKSKCDKDVVYDVVFTYSRCVDCECRCGK